MARRINQEHVSILRALFEEALRGFRREFAAGRDLSQSAARVHSAGQILLSAEVQLAHEELYEAIESGDLEKIEAAEAIYDQRLGVAQEFDILHRRDADRRNSN